MSRPVIRVLRHMARSGGTLISRCLGSMGGVALLSEIHPGGLTHFNPLAQAVEWHGLMTPGEVERLRRSGKRPGFAEVIADLQRRARERGLALVLREWSHLDVIGLPFAAPTMRPAMIEALAPRFEVVQAFTVRHPVDQHLSLSGLGPIPGLGLAAYLRGCRVFAQWAAEAGGPGFVRYEDFTRDPDAALATLCERLRVGFDPGYRDRWASYDKVTGDVSAKMGGRGAGEARIRPLEPRPRPEGLLEAFRAHDDYRITLELLGYDDA